jgi:hypothetical protein
MDDDAYSSVTLYEPDDGNEQKEEEVKKGA